DAADARSETVRRGILDWYKQVVLTRQQPGAAIVLIQTRWHLDDLAGTLLREDENAWRHLCFPALDEAGNPLWSDRYPREWLDRQQRAIGPDAFSALYQQNPVNLESQIFKPTLWRYYEPACAHRIVGTTVIAVDPAAGVGRDHAAFVVLRGNA